MLGLFQAFSTKCAQIQEAMDQGDDQRVELLDGSLAPLIQAILAYKAKNFTEIYYQLRFVSHLIEQEAGDVECVKQNTALLAYLIDRYFGDRMTYWRTQSLGDLPVAEPAAYVPKVDKGNFLNSAILNSMPDRIAVLTKDYRYLYSNSANCSFLKKNPMELIGCHLASFIGEDAFENDVKHRLDACFQGKSIDYFPLRTVESADIEFQYRLVPFYDPSGELMGALMTVRS